MKNIILIAATFAVSVTTFAQDSMNVHLLFHWNDTTLVGSNAYNNTYNEVWGFVQGGREYAVIGSTMGTHIFDVTDPINSTLVDFVPGATQGGSIVHRDFHDYNGYLYTASDEGASTLQIIDLSYLPDSVHKVYDSPSIFARAHNIFIDSTSGHLYQCGGNGNSGLTVIDISNPTSPVELKDYNSGYVHDVYVRHDTVYANQGYSGFFIYDFTNINNPQLIASLTSYPQQGYNHSGWLNQQGDLYIMSDETHGMDMKLFDVSDLGNITLIDTIGSEVHPLSIPHNQMIKGNKIFTSYYYDGLYIFDISDPYNPFIDGYYDTSTIPNSTSYEGAWGVYSFLPSGIVLLSDMQNGLYVFDVGDIYVNDESGKKAQKDIVVFPNPFVSSFIVSIPGFADSDIDHYSISDHLGNIVKQGRIDRSLSNITLSQSLATGIYYLHLSGQSDIFTKKLMHIN